MKKTLVLLLATLLVSLIPCVAGFSQKDYDKLETDADKVAYLKQNYNEAEAEKVLLKQYEPELAHIYYKNAANIGKNPALDKKYFQGADSSANIKANPAAGTKYIVIMSNVPEVDILAVLGKVFITEDGRIVNPPGAPLATNLAGIIRVMANKEGGFSYVREDKQAVTLKGGSEDTKVSYEEGRFVLGSGDTAKKVDSADVQVIEIEKPDLFSFTLRDGRGIRVKSDKSFRISSNNLNVDAGAKVDIKRGGKWANTLAFEETSFTFKPGDGYLIEGNFAHSFDTPLGKIFVPDPVEAMIKKTDAEKGTTIGATNRKMLRLYVDNAPSGEELSKINNFMSLEDDKDQTINTVVWNEGKLEVYNRASANILKDSEALTVDSTAPLSHFEVSYDEYNRFTIKQLGVQSEGYAESVSLYEYNQEIDKVSKEIEALEGQVGSAGTDDKKRFEGMIEEKEKIRKALIATRDDQDTRNLQYGTVVYAKGDDIVLASFKHFADDEVDCAVHKISLKRPGAVEGEFSFVLQALRDGKSVGYYAVDHAGVKKDNADKLSFDAVMKLNIEKGDTGYKITSTADALRALQKSKSRENILVNLFVTANKGEIYNQLEAALSDTELKMMIDSDGKSRDFSGSDKLEEATVKMLQRELNLRAILLGKDPNEIRKGLLEDSQLEKLGLPKQATEKMMDKLANAALRIQKDIGGTGVHVESVTLHMYQTGERDIDGKRVFDYEAKLGVSYQDNEKNWKWAEVNVPFETDTNLLSTAKSALGKKLELTAQEIIKEQAEELIRKVLE